MVESTKPINMSMAVPIIDKEIKRLIGELGYGKAGVMFMDHNEHKAIIRMNHNHVDEIRLALTLVKDINHEQVIIKTLGVSGILNKAKEQWF